MLLSVSGLEVCVQDDFRACPAFINIDKGLRAVFQCAQLCPAGTGNGLIDQQINSQLEISICITIAALKGDFLKRHTPDIQSPRV